MKIKNFQKITKKIRRNIKYYFKICENILYNFIDMKNYENFKFGEISKNLFSMQILKEYFPELGE